jgi:hypothetical protein
MSINFAELLNADQKLALIEGKIQQLALEGYQLQINKIALGNIDGAQESIAMLDANIATIAAAISAYQEELNNLK